MSGLDATTPIPTEIKLHQGSRVLEVAFNDSRTFRLPYEYLRVYSPSADAMRHALAAGKSSPCRSRSCKRPRDREALP